MSRRILITGGAGFVGASLALLLQRDGTADEIICLDNLYRRGSEHNVPRLGDAGVEFRQGDVRNAEDLEAVGPVDWLIECSAEPSVHAGYDGDPGYLLDTNLMGAVNCLEHLRKTGGSMVFLSTSRVYPIAPLRDLPLEEKGDRLVIAADARGTGWSADGIAEDFPLDGARSLYGATKLAAELLITEYNAAYGVRSIVNRCGVIAGPWQMGKVDQGFVALWVFRHALGGDLRYMGFGGTGRQVRDILHVEDLYDLLKIQMADAPRFEGRVFNVGGGPEISVSPLELTRLCEEVTGNRLEITSETAERAADIPYYVSDINRIVEISGWRPSRTPRQVVEDVFRWIDGNRDMLIPVFDA